MHHSFEEAVSALGLDKAMPRSILSQMNCEGDGAPQVQHIKSHLQRYRVAKRALEEATNPGDQPH